MRAVATGVYGNDGANSTRAGADCPRSIREECLNRVIPLGERHLRRTLADFVANYHGERNHQGLDNELIDRSPQRRADGPARRRQRVGGLLSSVTITEPPRSGAGRVVGHYGHDQTFAPERTETADGN
jgi:hypothetical protein